MKISNRYKEAFQRAMDTPAYWTESTLLDLARQLLGRMKEVGLSQKTLAEKMGKKAPYINRVLSGRHNVTMETISEAAFAMGMKVEIKLEPIKKGRQGGLLTSSNEVSSDALRPASQLRVIHTSRVAGNTVNVGPAEQFRKAA